MLTITLARDTHKSAPDRGMGTRFVQGQQVSLDWEVDYPGKPARYGGPVERWSFADCRDADWMYVFSAEDVAALEAPDTPAWRAFWAAHVPPFPVTYRPPRIEDREPDGVYCLPEPPPAYRLGDVIRVARPPGYAFSFPGAWEGEVVATRFYRQTYPDGEHSYRVRTTGGSVVWISPSLLVPYGCRIELVARAEAAQRTDTEEHPQ